MPLDPSKDPAYVAPTVTEKEAQAASTVQSVQDEDYNYLTNLTLNDPMAIVILNLLKRLQTVETSLLDLQVYVKENIVPIVQK